MIVMDDPRHLRMRNIVSRAFTPRVVARTEASVRDRARRLVETMIEEHPDGNGEVVTELAGPLPLQVICDMMGIPEEDHQQIFHWTNVILGFGDPDIATGLRGFRQGRDGHRRLCHRARRGPPGQSGGRSDDSLVQAEVDGERLTSAEIASFFILLVVAGNETTRNAISHGVLALTRYPDERANGGRTSRRIAQTAVEEIVRWASPVIYMRRTADRDVELSGVQMAAGDKVTLWYCSANRDEEKFVNPWTVRLRRASQPASRVRRGRRALLPRRQSGPT